MLLNIQFLLVACGAHAHISAAIFWSLIPVVNGLQGTDYSMLYGNKVSRNLFEMYKLFFFFFFIRLRAMLALTSVVRGQRASLISCRKLQRIRQDEEETNSRASPCLVLVPIVCCTAVFFWCYAPTSLSTLLRRIVVHIILPKGESTPFQKQSLAPNSRHDWALFQFLN